MAKKLDLSSAWSELYTKYYPTVESQEAAFVAKEFKSDFLEECLKLKESIRTALLSCSFPDIVSFLELNSTVKMMVRSSGKEDSVDLANAGGNESVPNVLPNPSDIHEASIKVVVSYFDPKSLRQRLRAGDRSIFSPSQLTPVIIQVMIGSSRGDQRISKCGVMFTEDTESAQKDSKQTTGITVIQSAYGHNEAVVLSLVPTDTFYVDRELHIYPIVREKKHRMVPTEVSGELKTVDNRDELRKSSSLSVDAVVALKIYANSLEEFYQRSMDTEFVVDEDLKTVFIVQARPIVKCASKAQPSYVSLISPADSVKLDPILVAGGAVRTCTKANTIIQKTIKQAYDIWETRKGVECVILEEMASVTSHYATEFRSSEILTVRAHDYEKIQGLIYSDKVVVICPQQGFAIIESEASFELKEGWISYPAPASLSVSKALGIDNFMNLTEPESLESLRSSPLLKKTLSTLIQMVESKKGVEWELLWTCYLKCNLAIHKYTATLNLEEWESIRIQLFLSALRRVIRAILGASEEKARMLAVHFFKTLLFQSYQQDIVSGMSLKQIIVSEYGPEFKTRETLKVNHDLTLTLLHFPKFAFTSELGDRFKDFILDLDKETSDKSLKQLSKLVTMISKAGIFMNWLPFVFPSITGGLTAMISDYIAAGRFIHDLQQEQSLLFVMELPSIGAEKSYNSQWKKFKQGPLAFFLSPDFPTGFLSASKLGRLTAIQAMSELVEKFDNSIKELEACRGLEEAGKLFKFQEMLKSYLALLETLFQCLFPLKLPRNADYVVRDLKNCIHRDLIATFTIPVAIGRNSEEFKFSRGFDASESCFNSVTAGTVMTGAVTLEDSFSSCHQNMQAVIGALLINEGAGSLALPGPLERAVKGMRNTAKKMVNFEMTNEMLKATYNIPLRYHSMQQSFVFNRKMPEQVVLTIRYSGKNVNSRWNRVILFVMLLRAFNNIRISRIHMAVLGVEFDVVIDADTDVAELYRLIDRMGSDTTFIADNRPPSLLSESPEEAASKCFTKTPAPLPKERYAAFFFAFADELSFIQLIPSLVDLLPYQSMILKPEYIGRLCRMVEAFEQTDLKAVESDFCQMDEVKTFFCEILIYLNGEGDYHQLSNRVVEKILSKKEWVNSNLYELIMHLIFKEREGAAGLVSLAVKHWKNYSSGTDISRNKALARLLASDSWYTGHES